MNTLSELKKEGITLFLAGDSLRFKAQRGITPAQRERIKRDREEIIRLIRQEETPHKCSDCSNFTGKWCSDHKEAWNGRALQSPDAVHSCRGFHAGQHTPEAIPHVTGEQQELFRSLIVQIETGQLPPPLWPKVYRYLKRRLPLYLFNALEELVQDQGDTTPQKEWLSPYPSRCFDCTRREGCQREERGQWGLLNRHECGEYKPMACAKETNHV